MYKKRPLVGVGVLVCKEDKVLLGYRIASHGADCWSPPGGHLEFGESIEACAQRELLEETGLYITQPKIIGITNDIFVADDKHYLTVFTAADWQEGDPIITEPDKCAEWRWFSWHALPEKLFLTFNNFLYADCSQFGQMPFDAFHQKNTRLSP